MKSKRIYKISAFVLATILISCSGVNNAVKEYSFMYLDDPNLVHPDYLVYHKSDTKSELHFRFKNSEVLYAKSPDDSIFVSNLTISYKLYSNFTQKLIADSGKVKLVDFVHSSGPSYLYGKIDMNAKSGSDYVLALKLNDDNRDLANYDLIDVEKSNNYNRQNFLVTDEDGNPVFNRMVQKGKDYTITTTQDFEHLQCRYYNREASLSPPPFSVEQPKAQSYIADSTYWIQVNDQQIKFSIRDQGFYHLVPDTNSREGLTLTHFNDDYPYVKTLDEMIKSVRFITSRNEFRNLENASSQKDAFERFWLSISSNPERAKLAIKAYYTRVQNANKFFSTHVPGWKTDRGLIYIVYEPPNLIYKKPGSESWIYGEEDNMLSINFAFYKVKNSFTENDFVLSRSAILKNSWYRAVDTWRQGRIF